MSVLVFQYQHCITEDAETVSASGICLVVAHGFFVGFHDEIVASVGCGEHEEGAHGEIEVGYHSIGYAEVVRRKDEAVGPAVVWLDKTIGTYCGLKDSLYGGAYGYDTVLVGLGTVYDLTGLGSDLHLFAVGLMFGEIFDVDVAEAAETAVEGDKGLFDTAYLHHLHQLGGKVQTCRGNGDGSFSLGKYRLKVVKVFWLGGTGENLAREGGFAQ